MLSNNHDRGQLSKMIGKKASSKKREKKKEKLSRIEQKERRWHMNLPPEILSKLPIKTSSGKWINMTKDASHPEEDYENENLSYEEQELLEEFPLPLESDKKDFSDPQPEEEIPEDIEGLKISINNASKLLKESTPEENIKHLEVIINSCTCKSDQIRHLAWLTALSVFKDIIPGYKIRDHSEEQPQVKLSKTIQVIRNFETFLVKYYGQYLCTLEKYMLNNSSCEDKFIITCIVGNLIITAYHFNHFDRLLKIITICIYSSDKRIVEKSCNFIKELFESDPHGEASKEMIFACSEAIQKRNYRKCPLNLLEALLSVRIKSEFSFHSQKTELNRKVKEKKDYNLSKRQKKLLNKHKKQIEDVIDAEAHHNSLRLQKWHEESLKYLLRIYFGIIKSVDYSNQLSLVLKGLGRIIHLLNPAYYPDLLKTLKSITEAKNLSFEISLHSILLITSISQMTLNNSTDLIVDYKFVHVHVFRLLKECPNWINYISMIRNCIDGIDSNTNVERRCAFAQRIADCALKNVGNNHICQMILQLLFHFMEKHSDRLPSLLLSSNENDPYSNDDGFGMGIYNPNIDDPDLSFPYSRSLNGVLLQIGSKLNNLKPLIDRIVRLGFTKEGK